MKSFERCICVSLRHCLEMQNLTLGPLSKLNASAIEIYIQRSARRHFIGQETPWFKIVLSASVPF